MATSMTGNPVEMARQCEVLKNKQLDTLPASTVEIDYSNAAGGSIYIPAGSPITTLTYQVSPVPGGTYVPLYDGAGAAVTRTVAAGRCYPIPVECYGCGQIKIVVNAAGPVDITLKG